MITFSRDVILNFVLNRGGVGIYGTVAFSRDVFLYFVLSRGGVGIGMITFPGCPSFSCPKQRWCWSWWCCSVLNIGGVGIGMITRVGQNHKYIYGVYTVFLAGKSQNIHIRCIYTVLVNPNDYLLEMSLADRGVVLE